MTPDGLVVVCPWFLFQGHGPAETAPTNRNHGHCPGDLGQSTRFPRTIPYDSLRTASRVTLFFNRRRHPTDTGTRKDKARETDREFLHRTKPPNNLSATREKPSGTRCLRRGFVWERSVGVASGALTLPAPRAMRLAKGELHRERVYGSAVGKRTGRARPKPSLLTFPLIVLTPPIINRCSKNYFSGGTSGSFSPGG